MFFFLFISYFDFDILCAAIYNTIYVSVEINSHLKMYEGNLEWLLNFYLCALLRLLSRLNDKIVCLIKFVHGVSISKSYRFYSKNYCILESSKDANTESSNCTFISFFFQMQSAL